MTFSRFLSWCFDFIGFHRTYTIIQLVDPQILRFDFSPNLESVAQAESQPEMVEPKVEEKVPEMVEEKSTPDSRLRSSKHGSPWISMDH